MGDPPLVTMNAMTLAIGGNPQMTILIASAALFGLVVIGFIAVVLIRRYYHESDGGSAGAGVGFTLQQLRQMRRDGEINDQQYEKLREQIVGVYKAGLGGESEPAEKAADASASPDREPPPDKQGGESAGRGG